ncbi:hypothetical protein [Hufsiella ginkgonis]|uniref:Uncharacterized protein n=1 Tax=Hufsiella ginkgonis TaxID=2695274 RepID=A0A7K1XY39_9SPHI|nr:hypothetical protein [Hufsiella ginkgonis]MXV15862.1 hypothetical protein [Hufsiella ginkgonis]
MENIQNDFNDYKDENAGHDIQTVTPNNDNEPDNIVFRVGGDDDDGDDDELIPVEGDDYEDTDADDADLDDDTLDDDTLDDDTLEDDTLDDDTLEDDTLEDDTLDDDFEEEDDDEELDPLADRPTTFESNANFSNNSHGRSTGTMVDHEPGIPGPIGGRQ